jgi:hypothetical protein
MAIPTDLLPLNAFCGKDKRLANEEGNILFKALILENVDRYNNETDKVRKMKLTSEILEEFKHRSNNGHFLKHIDGEWVPCDDSKARDKISHALRFQIRRRNVRPQLQREQSVPPPASENPTRIRTQSFDSCPGKIETTVPTDEFMIDDSSCDSLEYYDDSFLTDPLIFYEDMVAAGELNHISFGEYTNNDIVPIHPETQTFLSSTGENFEQSDLDGDTYMIG